MLREMASKLCAGTCVCVCVWTILLACTSKRQTATIRCLHSDSHAHSHKTIGYEGREAGGSSKGAEEPHAVSPDWMHGSSYHKHSIANDGITVWRKPTHCWLVFQWRTHCWLVFQWIQDTLLAGVSVNSGHTVGWCFSVGYLCWHTYVCRYVSTVCTRCGSLARRLPVIR